MQEIEKGIYVKGSKGNYRIVYPIKKDITKGFTLENINWKNLLLGGSWGKFFTFLLVLLLILGVAWSYKHDTQECFNLIENKTLRCQECYNLNVGDALNGSNVYVLPQEINTKS